MIFNIKGTSGSGKSTLVRKIMDLYDSKGKVHIDGRKQPLGYICHRKDGGRSLAIIGHYETDCGGCDTINKMEEIFELVRKSHEAGYDVIFEGLLISADVNRTAALHEEGLPLQVIALDISLEECLASVNKRRHDAWQRRVDKINAENLERSANGRKLLEVPQHKGDVNPKNTESKWKGVRLCMKRLEEQGVPGLWLDRDAAFSHIKKELSL